ncbi:ABC transporter substrate-binding protein [Fictibacillus norfolkensis]|uniref:Sugar ABC transporter substrate-binding protein n=1 Tax=Fictibacillus norfolkensis TaxID=2762233 RepID=A0ABR8SIA3_9BACL|nr:sugar ABC transporter substrate-binding protein [Fictibacillus norfolkensis]MBD7963228.1 sugar ABC transporter substrate-binding protein [Fictibacillus norfolkensis]
MKKRTKTLVSGSLAAALSLSLIACSNGEDDKAKGSAKDGELSGEVTLWTASLAGEPFDTYFKNIEKDFEKLHPKLDVVIEDVPQNEMEQKVLTSLTGDDVPDVVNLNPHYMSNIAAQGGLLDLTDAVSDETKDSFVEGPYESGMYDDKLYALPWYLTTTVSWYNNDAFSKAGVSELPTDTKGLYEAAKKVKDATGKPSYFPVINDGNTIMEKMVSIANGTPIVEDGKAKFADNKDLLEFFEATQKMYKEGIIPQEAAEGSIKTGQELYMAGNVSMLEGGVTFLGPIESGAPDVYKASKAGQPLNADDAPVNVAVMNFAVPAKTKNEDAAVALAEYVSNAENQLEFAKTAGTVLPATKKSLEDDYFKNPGDSPKAFGMLEASKSLSRAEVLIPPTENSADLRTATKNIFIQNLQGKLTPKEALKELASEWNKAFEKSDEKVTF